jgi:hypothetical protein
VNAPPHPTDGLGARHCLLLLGVFLATRGALLALGLRFHLDLAWMFLADLDALRDRLFETVYYFHAFAPGMNLITGALLKLAPAHLAWSATALFWASGYLLLVASCQLFQLLGCSKWTATLLALGLSLVPQSLYLENLYLYTHLCTSLLCWAAVAFHRALTAGTARSWFGFFFTCAVLGWLYTAFHLFWFLLLAGLAWALAGRGRRRPVLIGGALPLVLLAGLYVKNYAVFGVFGATSWGGANVTLATTQFMDGAQRREWIDNGELSPFAEISVFAGPAAYLSFFPADQHFPWPTTNELTRPAQGAPNFNHGIFLSVNRQRQKDASEFIRREPGQYLSMVLERNLPNMFSSTTHWHEADRTPNSPHYDHRRVLGRYERFYDRLVHSWPKRPVGLYWFLPLFYLWAAWSCWKDGTSRELSERRRGLLLGFCLLQIAFVVTASSLFSALESARYRYGIEPFIWAVVAVGLRAAVHRFGPGAWELAVQKQAEKDKLGIAPGPSASS